MCPDASKETRGAFRETRPRPVPPAMSRPNDGLIPTLVAGLLGTILCLALERVTHGLPATFVEGLRGVTPTLLQPFVEELESGFAPGASSNDMPTAAFLVIQTALWLLMACTGWFLLRRPATPRVLIAILVFSVLYRIVLLPSLPVHEADFNRYLWDGKSMVHGINPYLYEPGAVMLRELRIDGPVEIDGETYQGRPWSGTDEERLAVLTRLRDRNRPLHDRISDPHVPTYYPPLAQAVFAVSSALFGDSLLALKLIVVLFDLGIIVLLMRMLRRLGYNRAGVVFYAWSPLILISFANSAHYDAIPVFLLLLAISLAMPGQDWSSTGALAASALSKFFALALVPILFRPSWRHVVNYLFILACLLAGFLPFVVWQDAGFAQVFRGLASHAGEWQDMSGLFLIVDRLCATFLATSPENHVPGHLVAGLLFLVFLAWHGITPTPDHRTLLRKCFWIMGAVFVLSPAAFPWYYSWVIPFLCAFPRPSWVVLTLTLQAYYLQFHTDYGSFGDPLAGFPWLSAIVWLPFFLLWFLDPLLLRWFGTEETA